MEELIYWGIIFVFYLFSAYRSRQKKRGASNQEQEIQEFQIPSENTDPSQPQFNIFEYLNEAMEKSAIDLDNATASKESPASFKDDNKPLAVKENEPEIISNQNFDIKNQHLDQLESRITTGSSRLDTSSKRLKLIQQKLRNKPTKLGIVMQAIFEPPKSQGV